MERVRRVPSEAMQVLPCRLVGCTYSPQLLALRWWKQVSDKTFASTIRLHTSGFWNPFSLMRCGLTRRDYNTILFILAKDT